MKEQDLFYLIGKMHVEHQVLLEQLRQVKQENDNLKLQILTAKKNEPKD
jgi:hypothetical protein